MGINPPSDFPLPNPPAPAAQAHHPYHALTAPMLDRAFKKAMQGEQVIVSLPPGLGKSFGTLQAISAHDGPLKVLWFMPEAHDESLAATTQEQLEQLGVSAVRIYQLSRRSSAVRQRLLSWPEHTQVKLLAHAYLPLLYGASRVPSLQLLREADIIIVDESPFNHLLSLSGTAADKLQDGRSTALPLQVYLDDLSSAGLLTVKATAAYDLLVQRLSTGVRVQDDRQREMNILADDALLEALRPLLTHTSVKAFGRVIEPFWNTSRRSKATSREGRQVVAAVKQLVAAARQNLQDLLEGQLTHGIALVRFPDDEGIYVRNARFQVLDFGTSGVLHLDAFPCAPLISAWLPCGKVEPAPPELTLPRVEVEALVPEHPHDILTIGRKAVYYAESHARHHAVLQRALKLLGPRVVILAHRHFAQLYQKDLQRDYAPHTTEAQIIYWRGSAGLNAFAGWDAFIVNESRIPNRVLHLDLNAVTSSKQERKAILAHLEAADFLQLLHRIRPLTHRGRILVAFDPETSYESPLLLQNLKVVPVTLAPIRGKSEHVLTLELARAVVLEALQVWPGVPMRLLHLLLKLHPERPAEPWDEALSCFLDLMQARYRGFEWLSVKPGPGDRQDRGLTRLLAEEMELTAYTRPVPRGGRGRPYSVKVWAPVQGRPAEDVHIEVRQSITTWFERHIAQATSQSS